MQALRGTVTLLALFLWLTLVWTSALPDAATPDYLAVRALQFAFVYVVASMMGPSQMMAYDQHQKRVVLRWVLALGTLAAIIDILYASTVLVPVLVQLHRQTGGVDGGAGGLMTHLRFIITLVFTLISWLLSLLVTIRLFTFLQ